MHQLTFTYSQLSSESVIQLLAEHFALPSPVGCRFYILGLHDNYLIESGGQRFVFRVYRGHWRTLAEIEFELELLAFLGEKTTQVATPLRDHRGELKILIDCPEGQRAASLFSYAPGTSPGTAITPAQGQLLGQTVAQVHQHARGFTSPHSRPRLELPYLLDASLAAIDPFLEPDARDYLAELQVKIHNALPALPQQPGIYGICLGDVNLSNFHIDDNQHLTLFDFDQCGFGFRAFEIGKCFASLYTLPNRQEIAAAFLEGYQAVRSLTPAESEAIPYYELVAVIWVAAIHVYNAERVGYKLLEKPFWARRLGVLKDLQARLPS